MAFRLLHLPREMRDEIYFHALAPTVTSQYEHPRTFNVTAHDLEPNDYEWNLHKNDAVTSIPGITLLRTCKLISKEAVDVLYKSVHFRLISKAAVFMNMIGTENAARIRHLIIGEGAGNLWGGPMFSTHFHDRRTYDPNSEAWLLKSQCQVIANACSDLRTLELHCMDTGKFTAKTLLRDPGLIAARVADVESFAAAFTDINRHLVKALPQLRSTTLVTTSKSTKDLAEGPWPTLLLRAEEMGWTLKRQWFTETTKFKSPDTIRTISPNPVWSTWMRSFPRLFETAVTVLSKNLTQSEIISDVNQMIRDAEGEESDDDL